MNGAAAPDRDILSEAIGGDAREKRMWLVAQRAALDLHEKMGTLVSREFVAARLAEVYRSMAEALEKVPTRLAHDLSAESDPARIRERLSKELRGALSLLAGALDPASPEREAIADAVVSERAGHRGRRFSRKS